MKKITLLMALIAVSSIAFAQLKYSDDFSDYTVGNLELQKDWAVSTKASDAYGSSPQIINEQLSYSNYILSGQGKSIEYSTTGVDGTNNRVTSKVFGTEISTAGSLYVGFMVNFNNATQSNTSGGRDFFVATFKASGSTTIRGRVYLRKGSVANTVQVCISKNSTPSGTGAYWSANLALNQTHFLVVKHTVVGTNASSESNDTYRLYINPPIGETEANATVFTDAFDVTTVSDATGLNAIAVRQKGDAMKISGIRVSTAWEDVVLGTSSAPQLAAPVLGSATNVAAESFTANWTAVPNAVGYVVKVYEGVNLRGTYNVDGGSTETQFIKGLLTNTTYTYKVIAKGDGTNYSDSDESAASTEFTTLEGLTSVETDLNDGTWGTLYTSVNQPATGSFPSSYQNGFDLLYTFLYDIAKYDLSGNLRQNGLRSDKMSNGGMIVLPTVKTIGQLEIHAIPGGAPRSFTVKELVSSSWSTIGTFEMISSTDYSQFLIPISRSVPTKLRIENAGSGQITYYYIATRSTNPSVLPAPEVHDASGVLATKFTANWTPVNNATGYKVRVYQGTTEVATAVVNSNLASSVEVTGLEELTQYTYKVIALGDNGVNYLDSYLSAASPLFSTGTTVGVNSITEGVKLYVSNNQIVSSIDGNIEVFGMQGNLIFSAELKNAMPLNIANGLYLVRLTANDGNIFTTKISVR